MARRDRPPARRRATNRSTPQRRSAPMTLHYVKTRIADVPTRPTSHRSVRLFAHAAALGAAVLSLAPGSRSVSAAGQNSCLAGDVCVKDFYGSGTLSYGWTGNALNYSAYTYSDGDSVANNTSQGRNRNTTYPSACFYTQTNWNGSSILVPYAGVTWKNIYISTESHWKRIESYC